jgi:hypothetical protein
MAFDVHGFSRSWLFRCDRLAYEAVLIVIEFRVSEEAVCNHLVDMLLLHTIVVT